MYPYNLSIMLLSTSSPAAAPPWMNAHVLCKLVIPVTSPLDKALMLGSRPLKKDCTCEVTLNCIARK